MTEGRFETIHNLRPKNWDNRRHWTNWRHLYDCEADHLARESCPFHDLRSGGQFQYENWGSGPYAAPIESHRLNDRAAGDRMDFALGRGTALGGWGDLPLATEAAVVPRTRAVFTRKNPLKRGLFSEFPHMPEGGLEGGPAGGPADPRPGARESAGGMKTGGRQAYIGLPAEYIPDPYQDKINRGRRNCFRAGPVPHDYPKWMPEGEPDRRRRKKNVRPFYAGKHANAGLVRAGDVEWIPDPYGPARIDAGRRPFWTWHTRTKPSMPTHAPWSTGLRTAEPLKGATLNLTQENLPSLATYDRGSLVQTIGPEAALAGMNPPQTTLPRVDNGKRQQVKEKSR